MVFSAILMPHNFSNRFSALSKEESIRFGFDLFRRFVKIGHGRSFRKRGETKCLRPFYTAGPIAQVGLHAPGKSNTSDHLAFGCGAGYT